VRQHRENGEFFDNSLRNISGITRVSRVPDTISAYWVYTLLAEHRDELLKYLRDNGVYASKVHLRNDLYTCFGTQDRDLPGADEFHKKYLNIPCGWWVSWEDRDYIVDLLKKGW
jgi:dTDP-4-amino-4,6-dideoxygalactose transaminase